MKRTIIAAFSALLMLFFLNSCGEKTESNSEDKNKTSDFVVALPNDLSSLPFWVAKEEGVFDSLKVDVALKNFTEQLDCDVAFEKGKANILVSDGKRVKYFSENSRVKMDTLSVNALPIALVSNKKARVRMLKQLKEKMVAIQRNTTGVEMTYKCVDSVKLNRDNVYLVQINNPVTILQMLHNNALDAAVLTQPHVEMSKIEGHNVLHEANAEYLVVCKPAVKKHENAENLKRAYNLAVEMINKKGVKSYGKILVEQCKVQAKAVEKLPEIKFAKM